MFALRKIVENKLYAIVTKNNSDVFHDCFKKWQDVSFLYDYFGNNPDALHFYQVSKKSAVKQILLESEQFFMDILEIAEGKIDFESLDRTVFIPLHNNDDFNTQLLETKAYGKNNKPSFLRLYAIRLNDGCYIVVGGLIKITRTLQECKEGKEILKTIKQLVKQLNDKKCYDAFDIATIVL